jgi:hypothetical protein
MHILEVMLIFIAIISDLNEPEVPQHPLVQLIFNAPYETKFLTSVSAIFDILEAYANDASVI